MKERLAATQRYKVEERPKAISQGCFHSNKKKNINSTKAGAAERGDFLISFEPYLLGVCPFLFFPTLPSSEKSSMDFFFSLWGFVSSIVLKRLTLPKWIGLVHHLFVKVSLAKRVHPPRMTSRLFGRTLICPSRMNCTLLLPCFFSTKNNHAVLLTWKMCEIRS